MRRVVHMTTAKPLFVAILYVRCNMCGSITDCKLFRLTHLRKYIYMYRFFKQSIASLECRLKKKSIALSYRFCASGHLPT